MNGILIGFASDDEYEDASFYRSRKITPRKSIGDTPSKYKIQSHKKSTVTVSSSSSKNPNKKASKYSKRNNIYSDSDSEPEPEPIAPLISTETEQTECESTSNVLQIEKPSCQHQSTQTQLRTDTSSTSTATQTEKPSCQHQSAQTQVISKTIGVQTIIKKFQDASCTTAPMKVSSKMIQTESCSQKSTETTTNHSQHLKSTGIQTNTPEDCNSDKETGRGRKRKRKSASPELIEGIIENGDSDLATRGPLQVCEVIDGNQCPTFAQVDAKLEEYRKLTNTHLQSETICFSKTELQKQVATLSPKVGEWEEVYQSVYTCAFKSNMTASPNQFTFGYITIEPSSINPFEEYNNNEGPFIFTVIKGTVIFKTNQLMVENGITYLAPISLSKGGTIMFERGTPYSFENRTSKVAKLLYYVFNLGSTSKAVQEHVL